MAAKLKNLKVRKVDFVDEGANPDSHIKLFKSKESEGLTEERDSNKNTRSILKRLLGFIGKAAGINQEEIDSVVEEIQKSDSVSFNEKLSEAKNRKIADEIWDICHALDFALCSIINDDELDSSGVSAAMQESLEEFHAVVLASIKEWSVGKSASIVSKSEDVSEADIELMKYEAERINKSIEKASVKLQNKSSKNRLDDEKGKTKGDEEEMKIDKSKLTDAERAFLENIEKRCGVEDDNESSVGSQTQREQTVPTVTPPIQTSGTETPPNVNKSFKETQEISNQQLSDTDDIYKGLHPAVRAEMEALRKFREDAEDKAIHEVAKKYAIIGKKEEELVPLFKSLKAAGGTAYNDMIAVLDQAVDTVEKSGAFSEIGKSGHGGVTDGGAWAEADAKAVELMKSKTGLTKAQAIDEVLMANPELAERCEKED